MSNRICKGCGWVYPPSYNEARCRFCGTEFTERICPICKQLKVTRVPDSPVCRECYNEQRRGDRATIDSALRWRANKLQEVEDLYKDWLKRITAAPFVPLTEEDWLDACRYFGGCALCDVSEIEARGYFVQFDEGGRYTAWNILPLCERCATVLKKQVNPFRRLNTQINGNLPMSRGMSYKKLDRVYEYLQERLNKYEGKN